MSKNEHVLLTPGPLTTSQQTKEAMLYDWGSWDKSFRDLTAGVLEKLLAVLDSNDDYACVPMQGSGTFAVEAAIGTLVPRNGCVLIPNNGAYCKRIRTICQYLGIETVEIAYAENVPIDPEEIRQTLQKHSRITHIAIVHCETSAGILNPLAEIAVIAEEFQKAVIVDAMSSFGALPIPTGASIHAVISASGKCLEGVPGMGFVFVRKAVLLAAKHRAHSLSLDLYDQWVYYQETGQWRFTPPTHVVAALNSALDQFFLEGGRESRYARYQHNAEVLCREMDQAGFSAFISPVYRSPIIVTFYAPKSKNYSFSRFYDEVKRCGFILYPGKMTQQETFRVGCIGHFSDMTIKAAVEAMQQSLKAMGV